MPSPRLVNKCLTIEIMAEENESQNGDEKEIIRKALLLSSVHNKSRRRKTGNEILSAQQFASEYRRFLHSNKSIGMKDFELYPSYCGMLPGCGQGEAKNTLPGRILSTFVTGIPRLQYAKQFYSKTYQWRGERVHSKLGCGNMRNFRHRHTSVIVKRAFEKEIFSNKLRTIVAQPSRNHIKFISACQLRMSASDVRRDDVPQSDHLMQRLLLALHFLMNLLARKISIKPNAITTEMET